MASDQTPKPGRPDTPPADIAPQDIGLACYFWPPGLKRINLALQGGGAHGAFTWGVLDKILEDGRIAIEAISATSAGAMNGALLAQGLVKSGPDGAREQLEKFWKRVSATNWPGAQWLDWFESVNGWNRDSSPVHLLFDLASRLWSPYQMNPLDVNPLRDLLRESIDMEHVRACHSVKLFISATNVETGKIRVFDHAELTVDCILASACLPHVFRAVEVDGGHYWDGGYMGNPAIYPLIYHSGSRDVMIVRINPIVRRGVPTTARDILNRLNEITFNSSLMREMRAIAFVTRMLEDGKINDNTMKRMLIHMIEADDLIGPFGVASKMNPDWRFLTHLRDIGRERAQRWIDANFNKLGVESTVDIHAEFL